MKARTHYKYFQDWRTLQLPGAPGSIPPLVQFHEPNNAAEPSANEESERRLRFDHPSLCYQCRLPNETFDERNQRRMVSAIALTHMVSCDSCDQSHDLSNHPLLDRDLDKSRGTQYTM